MNCIISSFRFNHHHSKIVLFRHHDGCINYTRNDTLFPINNKIRIFRFCARMMYTRCHKFSIISSFDIITNQKRFFNQTKRIKEHKIRERMPMKLTKNSKLRETMPQRIDPNDKWTKWRLVIEKCGKMFLKIDTIIIGNIISFAILLSIYQLYAYHNITWTDAVWTWLRNKVF